MTRLFGVSRDGYFLPQQPIGWLGEDDADIWN
jgi:hypothetical protein